MDTILASPCRGRDLTGPSPDQLGRPGRWVKANFVETLEGTAPRVDKLT